MKKNNLLSLSGKLLEANFRVYSRVMNYNQLTKSEQLVYSLIKSFIDGGLGFDKSSAYIAAYIGLSERTVKRSISKLENLGYIVVFRTKNSRYIETPKTSSRLEYIKKMLE